MVDAGESAAGDVGKEPDYRFTLANERTFLSWIRTSLALIAGGIALRAFAEEFGNQVVPLVTALLATVLGGALTVLAFRHWHRVQRSMRLGLPLPRQVSAVVLTAGVVLIALLMTMAIIW
jgi:putative membrane protein